MERCPKCNRLGVEYDQFSGVRRCLWEDCFWTERDKNKYRHKHISKEFMKTYKTKESYYSMTILTYKQFLKTSKEWKKRVYLSLLGLENPTFKHRCKICGEMSPVYSNGICVDCIKPHESLDQVRLLEQKAKKDKQIWSIYDGCIFSLVLNNINASANIAYLTADKKLYYLFQAFGVDFSKEEK